MSCEPVCCCPMCLFVCRCPVSPCPVCFTPPCPSMSSVCPLYPCPSAPTAPHVPPLHLLPGLQAPWCSRGARQPTWGCCRSRCARAGAAPMVLCAESGLHAHLPGALTFLSLSSSFLPCFPFLLCFITELFQFSLSTFLSSRLSHTRVFTPLCPFSQYVCPWLNCLWTPLSLSHSMYSCYLLSALRLSRSLLSVLLLTCFRLPLFLFTLNFLLSLFCLSLASPCLCSQRTSVPAVRLPSLCSQPPFPLALLSSLYCPTLSFIITL